MHVRPSGTAVCDTPGLAISKVTSTEFPLTANCKLILKAKDSFSCFTTENIVNLSSKE